LLSEPHGGTHEPAAGTVLKLPAGRGGPLVREILEKRLQFDSNTSMDRANETTLELAGSHLRNSGSEHIYMLISVINDSDGYVEDRDLLRAIRAINRQIDHDFRPYWHLGGELRLVGCKGCQPIAKHFDVAGEALIMVESVSKKAEGVPWYTAGYHEKAASGFPVAHIFADCAIAGLCWELVLSHESLELIVNPLINLYVPGPSPDRHQRRRMFHSYEVCDAVMSESYELEGVTVSNFLLPLYFVEDGEKKGRIVYQQRKDLKPLQSFGLNLDGYVPYHDPEAHKDFEYYLKPDENGQLVGYRRESRHRACNKPDGTEESTPP
jgi:hypothetical protein